MKKKKKKIQSGTAERQVQQPHEPTTQYTQYPVLSGSSPVTAVGQLLDIK